MICICPIFNSSLYQALISRYRWPLKTTPSQTVERHMSRKRGRTLKVRRYRGMEFTGVDHDQVWGSWNNPPSSHQTETRNWSLRLFGRQRRAWYRYQSEAVIIHPWRPRGEQDEDLRTTSFILSDVSRGGNSQIISSPMGENKMRCEHENGAVSRLMQVWRSYNSSPSPYRLVISRVETRDWRLRPCRDDGE